ncbi:cis-Golgi t-SNARE syntaxin [Clydaea vesicula]|uniref:Cis-Golgi t-SNARE syntaxin n=1 Tax=Clydaea vesicula TaxID=447962 RepID=A0AAD5TY78_9FUNG|nr:cis-Golgi t-SNARE syntaxin [Clydaea vesicula]
MQDRTNEFNSILQSLNTQGQHQQLLNSNRQNLKKSEFTKASYQIGKEIQQTLTKLNKLTVLAKKKTLFDDKPVEINELVFVIKQDISKINKLIMQLSQYQSQQLQKESKLVQSKEHEVNVINSLQTKLQQTSQTFKSILEIRTENMKEQKERRDQYSFGSSQQSMLLSQPPSDSPLYNPNQPAQQNQNETVLDFGEFGLTKRGKGGQQQLELMQTNSSAVNDEIINSRDSAIDSIESTIAELGQIYQNFAVLLQGQREAVMRIDQNVEGKGVLL